MKIFHGVDVDLKTRTVLQIEYRLLQSENVDDSKNLAVRWRQSIIVIMK